MAKQRELTPEEESDKAVYDSLREFAEPMGGNWTMESLNTEQVVKLIADAAGKKVLGVRRSGTLAVMIYFEKK